MNLPAQVFTDDILSIMKGTDLVKLLSTDMRTFSPAKGRDKNRGNKELNRRNTSESVVRKSTPGVLFADNVKV